MSNDAVQAELYRKQVGTGYSWYVLAILFAVYALNFIDRQILGILAPQIAKDLNLSLADLGFLYGTAFAVFYALFGIPLGKLADMWVRTRLMAFGLALWSGMTALSGFASSLTHLTLARIGVGIGEASASPCAYSLISDYFPKEKRATALAIYGSGLFFGGGISLYAGGAIADGWTTYFAGREPLFGLRGWQAAFIIVGLPGLLLALIVASIREPVRGLADGIVTPKVENPWPKFFDELSSVIPPFTLLHLIRHKASARLLLRNLLLAALLASIAWTLTHTFGDWKQWSAIAVGAYAVTTWAQSLRLRDAASYQLIWGTPTFLLVVAAGGLISLSAYVFSYFSVQYAMPFFGFNAKQAGLLVGLPGAVFAAVGATIGGIGADWLVKRHASGRLIWALIVSTVTVPFAFIAFNTTSQTVFLLNFCLMNLFGSMWLGGCAASIQDLVLPRMRGIAAATFFVGTTLIGLALGPYFAGMVADMQIPAAAKAAGPSADTLASALRIGILSSFWACPLAIICLLVAIRQFPAAIATKTERARAMGETL
jgi:MFS family permease